MKVRLGTQAHYPRVVALRQGALMQRMLAVVVMSLALAGIAAAANCGGGVQCQCGDEVTSSYVLTAPLGPCTGHGLIVTGANIDIHLNGKTISGPANGDDFAGVYLNGATNPTVHNGIITGFRHNLRVDTVSGGAAYALTLKLAKGTNTARGAQIADSVGFIFRNSTVDGSQDECVHIGGGSENQIRFVTCKNTAVENFYLLNTANNTLTNPKSVGGTNGAFVKNSDGNVFLNANLNKPTRVEDSHNNVFDNLTQTGQFRIIGILELPAGNQVTESTLMGAGTCFRSDNTGNNQVDHSIFKLSCNPLDAACTVAGDTLLLANTYSGAPALDPEPGCTLTVQ